MRNAMLKTIISSALIATTMQTVHAAEQVHLIIEKASPNMTRMASVGSDALDCIMAPNGAGQWCLPSKASHSASAQSTGAKLAGKTRYQTISLDSHGYSTEEVVSLLQQSGRFGQVEPDYIVRTIPSIPSVNGDTYATSYGTTDDPDSYSQDSFYADAGSTPTGMSVRKAWDAHNALLGNDGDEPLDIIVLDSSFFENEDIPYTDGRSFSTVALETGEFDENDVVIKKAQERNDDYRPRKDNEMYPMCNGHGLGVIAAMAATANNQIGTAGVLNNVNTHVIRVMTCGTGRLSDTVDALSWLAGDTEGLSGMENVTPYQGKPGIVNMSLAAPSSTGECSTWVQDAVDSAIAAGFTLVAAAANNSENAGGYMPANCDGVITVAALDQAGELASFSNYGDVVDIAAQGTSIPTVMGEDSDQVGYWDGTSFASPLVAGILASAKRLTGATDSQLKAALTLTATPFPEGSGCVTGGCGAGVPNLDSVIRVASGLADGSLNTLSFALADKTECEQSWFVDNFGETIPMCAMYKVQFMGGYEKNSVSYELVSVPQGESFDGDLATVVGTFSKGTVYLEDIDVATKDYGFKLCENGVCDSNILMLDETDAQESKRPVACK